MENENAIKDKSLKHLALANSLISAGASDMAATLLQNNPNPFNERTEIKYHLPAETSQAQMYFFDMQGKEIERYDLHEFGNSSLFIEAASLSPGMYFYSLIADGKEIDTKKMILTER